MEDIFINTPYQNFLKLTDCILVTEDGGKFKAHRIILAQSSKYFERLFCGDFRQSVESVVPDVKGDILNQILCYIYHKKNILSPESMLDILIASDFLMITELFEDCKKFLFDEGITTSNCIAVFSTALKIELKEIIASSKRFIEIHFEEAVSQEGNKLGELNISAFTEILNCDNLNISDESIVWNAVVSWINQNISERMSYFPELLKYVRLQELDETSIPKLNLPHVIENNEFCFDANRQCSNQITAISLMVKEAQSLPITATGLRKHRIPNCMYFICKEVINKNIKLYVTYDNSLDYCLYFGKLSSGNYTLSKVDVCNAGRVMYFSFCSPPTMIKAFDVIDGRWIVVNPVPQERKHYYIVAVKSKLFALGGMLPTEVDQDMDEDFDENMDEDIGEDVDEDFGEDVDEDINEDVDEDIGEDVVEDIGEDLNEDIGEVADEDIGEDVDEDTDEDRDEDTDEDTDEEFEDFDDNDDIDTETIEDTDLVHCFDLQSNTWEERRPMYSVCITGIVALNDYIYVFGESRNFQNIVFQFYDPFQDCWTLLPGPNIYCTDCEVIAFRGNLYLIDGVGKKVQEYNPTLNTWNELPDLPYAYPKPKVIVIEKTMIVFDKHDEENNSHPAVYWCKEKHMWEVAPNLCKKFLEELRRKEIVSINDETSIKSFCQKHRCKGSKWIKSELLPLASEIMINLSEDTKLHNIFNKV